MSLPTYKRKPKKPKKKLQKPKKVQKYGYGTSNSARHRPPAPTVQLPKFHNKQQHFTNTTWNIWAHDKADADFTNDSYKKCFTIATLEDFWVFFNNVNDFTRHQFYVMRKDIAPIYEVPENIDGGAYSFLITTSNNVKNGFIALTIRVISENLLPPKHYNQVTGIYLNPKPEGANIKVWFRDHAWLRQNHSSVFIDDQKLLKSKRISKHKLNT